MRFNVRVNDVVSATLQSLSTVAQHNQRPQRTCWLALATLVATDLAKAVDDLCRT